MLLLFVVVLLVFVLVLLVLLLVLVLVLLLKGMAVLSNKEIGINRLKHSAS